MMLSTLAITESAASFLGNCLQYYIGIRMTRRNIGMSHPSKDIFSQKEGSTVLFSLSSNGNSIVSSHIISSTVLSIIT